MPYIFRKFKPGDLITWIDMYRSWVGHRGYGEVVMFIRYTDGLPRNFLQQCEVLMANGKLGTFLSEDFEKYKPAAEEEEE